MKFTRILNKNITFFFVFALILVSFSLGYFLPNLKNSNYVEASTTVTITNGNFNSNPNAYYLESPSGWQKLKTNSLATSGIINTNSKNFDQYKTSSYHLSENPQTKMADTNDTKILMINARNTNSNNNTYSQGYKSNSITLSPYCYYHFSVLVKVELGAQASIYFTGIKNNTITFEKIGTDAYFWNEYDFFIETGSISETVNFELWLGTNNGITSNNAVFFDNIKGEKLTKSHFDQISLESSKAKKVVIEKNFITEKLIKNNDFEPTNPNNTDGKLTDWSAINAFPSSTTENTIIYNVVNVTHESDMLSRGFSPLGNDKMGGDYALLLASEQTPPFAFGYKSVNIALPRFAIYKININAKVGENTTARIVIKENDDVKNFYEGMTDDERDKFDTPDATSISITSNPTNEILNNYNTYSFYLKGHSLFDTSVVIELWLGSEETPSSGSVVFDNILIEALSTAEFAKATENSTTKKLELKVDSMSGSTSITNGTFNKGSTTLIKIPAENPEEISNYYTFPVKPDNFTSVKEDENNNIYGIINTNSNYFMSDNYLNENEKLAYGTNFNPGNPQGFIKDTTKETNNVLMLWNKTTSFQNSTSDSFTVADGNFYNLSFSFRTLPLSNEPVNFNISLINQDNSKVFEKENCTSNEWENFSITIRGGKTVTSLKLVLSLGTEKQKSIGYVFIDNIDITTLSNFSTEQWNTKIQTQNAFNTVLDLTNALININLAPNNYGIIPTETWNGALESGNQNPNSDPIAESGIINGSNNIKEIFNFTNENLIKNIMFIQTHSQATYSLTSKSKISLTSGKIYKFSVFLQTKLSLTNNELSKILDGTLSSPENYSAIFSLVGVDGKVENIRTNGEWTEYQIIVNADKSTNVQLKFTLSSLNTKTLHLYVDNFTLTEISSEDYKTIVDSYDDETQKTMSIVGSTTFEEDTTDEETDDEQNSNNFNWLLAPSLIFALAMIIAVVGVIFKKFKFKKHIKIKTEYDRRKSVSYDIYRVLAEEKRDIELKELNEKLKNLENEISQLEENNKKRLAENRKEKGTVIDRKAEKEFKTYASKHTSLVNSKEKLIEKMKEMNSADYLLNLQKKINAENTKKIKIENKELKEKAQSTNEKKEDD